MRRIPLGKKAKIRLALREFSAVPLVRSCFLPDPFPFEVNCRASFSMDAFHFERNLLTRVSEVCVGNKMGIRNDRHFYTETF